MKLSDILETLTVPMGDSSKVDSQLKAERKKRKGVSKEKRGNDAVRRWREAREQAQK